MRVFLISLISCILSLAAFAAEGTFPAWYETTAALNMRTRDNTRAKKLITIPPHTRVKVESVTSNNWGIVNYSNYRGYVSMRYLKYADTPTTSGSASDVSHKSAKAKKSKSLWSWILTIALWTAGIVLVRNIAINLLDKASRLMYRAYWIVCMPFYCLNWLQRFLA